MSGFHRVPIRVANCEGVSERNPGEEARLALTSPGRFGLPKVIALCEVSWLDVEALAGRLGLYGIQDGDLGSPEAGVALVSQKPIRMRRSVVGSPGNSRVRARTILGTMAYGAPFWAVHAPPRYAGQVHDDYIRKARARAGVIMGDWNEPVVEMKRSTRRQYRGHGVLGAVVSRQIRASMAHTTNIESDHPAVDLLLRIPR